MHPDRFSEQLQFILEVDKLKSILRRSYLLHADRRENSAEHSWHLALMAIVLAEYANEPIDLLTVLKMLLVHDIVEVDAGDTFVYDAAAQYDKAERETRAAVRLFGLLPEDQAAELMALWEAFERRDTPEARFAAALDRFIPFLHNLHTEGRGWREHAVTREQVLQINRHTRQGSETIWLWMETQIAVAAERGLLGGEFTRLGDQA
jgi:putative hydrolase of HD superfamily